MERRQIIDQVHAHSHVIDSTHNRVLVGVIWQDFFF